MKDGREGQSAYKNGTVEMEEEEGEGEERRRKGRGEQAGRGGERGHTYTSHEFGTPRRFAFQTSSSA